MRAEHVADDLYAAIDYVQYELKRELLKAKERNFLTERKLSWLGYKSQTRFAVSHLSVGVWTPIPFVQKSAVMGALLNLDFSCAKIQSAVMSLVKIDEMWS